VCADFLLCGKVSSNPVEKESAQGLHVLLHCVVAVPSIVVESSAGGSTGPADVDEWKSAEGVHGDTEDAVYRC